VHRRLLPSLFTAHHFFERELRIPRAVLGERECLRGQVKAHPSRTDEATGGERGGATGRRGRRGGCGVRRDAEDWGPLLARALERGGIRARDAVGAGADTPRDRAIPRAPARAGAVDGQQGEPLWPQDAHDPLRGQLPRPVRCGRRPCARRPVRPARPPCAPALRARPARRRGAVLLGARGS
jgi:hypothetical protein